MNSQTLFGVISPAVILLFAAGLYALIEWALRNPNYSERRLNTLLILASLTVFALVFWNQYHATLSYPAN